MILAPLYTAQQLIFCANAHSLLSGSSASHASLFASQFSPKRTYLSRTPRAILRTRALRRQQIIHPRPAVCARRLLRAAAAAAATGPLLMPLPRECARRAVQALALEIRPVQPPEVAEPRTPRRFVLSSRQSRVAAGGHMQPALHALVVARPQRLDARAPLFGCQERLSRGVARGNALRCVAHMALLARAPRPALNRLVYSLKAARSRSDSGLRGRRRFSTAAAAASIDNGAGGSICSRQPYGALLRVLKAQSGRAHRSWRAQRRLERARRA